MIKVDIIYREINDNKNKYPLLSSLDYAHLTGLILTIKENSSEYVELMNVLNTIQ